MKISVIAAASLACVIWSMGAATQAMAADSELEAVKVRPDFYMIAGAGGNIGIDIGSDGVVVVGTGSAAHADDVIALIKQLTMQPIRYIIDTSADPDSAGGNAKLSRAGLPILPAGYNRPGGGPGLAARDFAPILAEEHVLDRMSSAQDKWASRDQAGWVTSTYSIELGETQRKMFLNGQGIRVIYQAAAHSDGDSIVLFRGSDVFVVGDIMDLRRFPVIDPAEGGSIQGSIAALNRVLDLSIESVPFPHQDGGTLIIPGHGRIATWTDLVEYRDMLTIIRDRIADGVNKGRTLTQVLAADPTQGYRRRFGADSGDWTTAMFVTAIYHELESKRGSTPAVAAGRSK
jgi:glyoxylase-like metal-dependent hydrolase (beta-lactamase superfamily II)